MKLEIFENDSKLDFENVMFKTYKEGLVKLRESVNIYEVEFYSIKKLKGEKTLLQKAFRDELAEQLN